MAKESTDTMTFVIEHVCIGSYAEVVACESECHIRQIRTRIAGDGVLSLRYFCGADIGVSGRYQYDFVAGKQMRWAYTRSDKAIGSTTMAEPVSMEAPVLASCTVWFPIVMASKSVSHTTSFRRGN